MNLFYVPDLSPSLGASAHLIGQIVLCDQWLLLLTKKMGFLLGFLLNLVQSRNVGIIPEGQGFIAIAFQSLIMWPYLACMFTH